MSTKAIREALTRLEILMEEPPAGMSVEDAVLLNSARTEVEAIEKAAAEFYENGMHAHYDVAFGLMERIARQND